MASHNRTPKSILDAPGPTQEWVSEQHANSREEKRRGVRWPAYRSPEEANVLKASSILEAQRATNTIHFRIAPRLRAGKTRRRGGRGTQSEQS